MVARVTTSHKIEKKKKKKTSSSSHGRVGEEDDVGTKAFHNLLNTY
jgi:hypothetical protein